MNKVKKLKKINHIFILLLISLLIFLYQLNKFDFHFDEIHCFYWSSPELSLSEVIERLRYNEMFHPPLFFLINNLILKIKGNSEFARYITVFTTILSLIVFYEILKKKFEDKNLVFLGSLLFITNIFIIFHAQRFTNYPLLLLIELLTLYNFQYLRQNFTIKRLFLLFFLSFLGFFTHIYYSFFIGSICLWTFLFCKKRRLQIFFTISLSFIIFFIFFNDFIFNALSSKAFNYSKINLNLIFLHFHMYFYGGKYITYIILVFLAFYLVKNIQKFESENCLYIIFLIFPYLSIYIFNKLFLSAWIDPKHIIYFVPIIIIIILDLLNKHKKKINLNKFIIYIPIVILILGQTISLYRNYFINDFNSNKIVKKNVDLKNFLNMTSGNHDLIFVVEKGSDKWPSFNNNLKYYMQNNNFFLKKKIKLISSDDDEVFSFNSFIYIYYKDSLNETTKSIKKYSLKYKKIEYFDSKEIKGVLFKKG